MKEITNGILKEMIAKEVNRQLLEKKKSKTQRKIDLDSKLKSDFANFYTKYSKQNRASNFTDKDITKIEDNFKADKYAGPIIDLAIEIMFDTESKNAGKITTNLINDVMNQSKDFYNTNSKKVLSTLRRILNFANKNLKFKE